MTTPANLSTTATAIVTALATAQSNANTLANNTTGPSVAVLTLNTLATVPQSNWKGPLGDARAQLLAAAIDLGAVTDRFTQIASKFSAIAAGDA